MNAAKVSAKLHVGRKNIATVLRQRYNVGPSVGSDSSPDCSALTALADRFSPAPARSRDGTPAPLPAA